MGQITIIDHHMPTICLCSVDPTDPCLFSYVSKAGRCVRID